LGERAGARGNFQHAALLDSPHPASGHLLPAVEKGSIHAAIQADERFADERFMVNVKH